MTTHVKVMQRNLLAHGAFLLSLVDNDPNTKSGFYSMYEDANPPVPFMDRPDDTLIVLTGDIPFPTDILSKFGNYKLINAISTNQMVINNLNFGIDYLEESIGNVKERISALYVPERDLQKCLWDNYKPPHLTCSLNFHVSNLFGHFSQ